MDNNYERLRVRAEILEAENAALKDRVKELRDALNGLMYELHCIPWGDRYNAIGYSLKQAEEAISKEKE